MPKFRINASYTVGGYLTLTASSKEQAMRFAQNILDELGERAFETNEGGEVTHREPIAHVAEIIK